MGGGDLNLKKSWHPSTLRNIERVWKAEQMRDQEKAKIEQLQKELQEERNKQEMRQYAEKKGVVKKREERLDWMYQGVAGLVDREQYLLGRKVDKNFEIMKKEEEGVQDKNEDQEPGSIFVMAPTNAAVDLENKIREDPLFAIRKQEMKTKKTLLSNPVKMKHLREMIEQSIKSSKKAHKKKKKKKHKKKSRSSSSSSNSSGDDQPAKQARIEPERRDAGSHRRDDRDHSTRHRSRSPDAGRHHRRDVHRGGNRSEKSTRTGREEKPARKRHDSSSESDGPREAPLKRPIKSSSQSESKRQKHDSSQSDSSTKNCREENGQQNERPKFGLIIRGDQSHRRERQPPPVRVQPKEQSKPAPQVSQKRRPLSEEEKAAARREMMENAQWRDEQRKTFVSRYRESDAAEEKHCHKNTGEGFIRPMLAKAADSGSVENRIKQKMYTVQRSSSAMDVHFARK
ncbi:CWC25 spliceosome associated protein homolog [Haemaphysalis longicornis]